MSFGTFCFLLPAITLTLADEGAIKYDILYLQDVTSPFANQANVVAAVTKFFDLVKAKYPGSLFKAATFSDAPVVPFGCDYPDYKDHCYKNVAEWSPSVEVIRERLNEVRFAYGFDPKEGSNMAMNFAARAQFNSSHLDHRKIILVTTDNGYHKEGDMGKLIRSVHYDKKCHQVALCCGRHGATRATANITVIPNRNGADGHLTCGFSKDGEFIRQYEEFPNEAGMYKYMADHDIAVMAIPMVDIVARTFWRGAQKVMHYQGGLMAVKYGGDLSREQGKYRDPVSYDDFLKLAPLREKIYPNEVNITFNSLMEAFQEMLPCSSVPDVEYGRWTYEEPFAAMLTCPPGFKLSVDETEYDFFHFLCRGETWTPPMDNVSCVYKRKCALPTRQNLLVGEWSYKDYIAYENNSVVVVESAMLTCPEGHKINVAADKKLDYELECYDGEWTDNDAYCVPV